MLPEWIPKDAWDGFISMRKKMKKAPTDRAITLLVNQMQVMLNEGRDESYLAAVLDQSTINGWTGIFPLREQRQAQSNRPVVASLGKHGQATANNAQEWLEGQ